MNLIGTDLDDILGDIEGGEIDIKKLINSSVQEGSGSKTPKEPKENKVVDYQSFSKENSIVLDITDAKRLVQLAKAIPNINEQSAFVGLLVKGGKLEMYVSNVTEYLKSDFDIRNKTNVMQDGEFMVFPIDTIIKALRATNGVLTIFKDETGYRLSVIGGSIPVENNTSIPLDRFNGTLNFGDSKIEIDVEQYKNIVGSLAGLASYAVAVQQKKINIKNGTATANFLRCLAKKFAPSGIELSLRVVDMQIIQKLIDSSVKNIYIYKDSMSRLIYEVGNSLYSCVEGRIVSNETLENTFDAILVNSTKVVAGVEDLTKLSTLLTSLPNVDENFTLTEKDGNLVISSKISGQLNSFDIPITKLSNDIYNKDIMINSKMFDFAISSYGDNEVTVYLNDKGIILESKDKRVMVGSEIF